MNSAKIQQLQKTLAENNQQLAYINDPGHIGYFTGYAGNPHERIMALFIPVVGDPFLFTPALDVEMAQATTWAYDVVGYLDSEDPWAIIGKELNKRYTDVANFAIEKNSMTIDRLEAMQSLLPKASFAFDLTGIIQRLQLIKTPKEISLLMEAGKWADKAFAIGFAAVKAGATEAEITAAIEFELKKQEISMSFETIVLGGENAANPHGVPGMRQISNNELVLFDLGTIWQGYCSDATRTIACGEPTDFQRKIYEIVLEAQLAAQAAVKPGVTAAQLDKIARDVITEAGYGKYFNHRLGHGIGTTIHEFPSLVEGNDLVIEAGMCFSLEPGIYIPGEVGVRIEDCVTVTEDGCVPFTNTTKELTIY